MDKSGVYEGNKRKAYHDVGTSRGDVGGMRYSTGRSQAGATSALTSTARGKDGGAAKSAPSLGTGDRPRSSAVDRGLGASAPKSGADHKRGQAVGLNGGIYKPGGR
jgi:hypothetical protein